MFMRRAGRAGWTVAMFATMLMLGAGPVLPQGGPAPGRTPAEMVATYNTLADAILAVKNTETNIVKTILSATYAHARVELERARKAIKGGDAKASETALENLAADVAEMGTEGDNAVGAVRKRLLEGGHHHHADGEAKGIYDEGYVVVTRVAKQAFLDAAKAIGQMAHAPKAEALESAWTKVDTTWAGLLKENG